MAKFKYLYRCPQCGTELQLRMRVTLTKRKCPNCGTPITPEEIDRQEYEKKPRYESKPWDWRDYERICGRKPPREHRFTPPTNEECMIWFACISCGKHQGRPDNLAGAMVFCECGEGNRVPWNSTVPEPGPEGPGAGCSGGTLSRPAPWVVGSGHGGFAAAW